jgi:hypothetical protein
MHVRNSRLFSVRWRWLAGLWFARTTIPLRRVRWRLLPRAALRLAGWAWVLPFAALGWAAGTVIKAGRAALVSLRLGYRSGDRR